MKVEVDKDDVKKAGYTAAGAGVGALLGQAAGGMLLGGAGAKIGAVIGGIAGGTMGYGYDDGSAEAKAEQEAGSAGPEVNELKDEPPEAPKEDDIVDAVFFVGEMDPQQR